MIITADQIKRLKRCMREHRPLRGYDVEVILRKDCTDGRESYNLLITEVNEDSDMTDQCSLADLVGTEIEEVNGEVQLDIMASHKEHDLRCYWEGHIFAGEHVSTEFRPEWSD